MAGHLMFNKKGISEMIGYVLLIVIALSLSVLVYIYLEKLTPKGKIECPEGVSISIRTAECNSETNQLKLEFFNNGLFKVDGVYVKLGQERKSTRTNLNDPEDEQTGKNPFYMSLEPQKAFSQTYNLARIFDVEDNNIYILDLQPAIAEKDGPRLAVCEGTTISQKITCKPTAAGGTPPGSGSGTSPATPSITIDSPTSGDTFIGNAGTIINIVWSTQNWPASITEVNIELIDTATNLAIPIGKYPNNGLFKLNIDPARTTTKTHRIRVYAVKEGELAPGEQGTSEIFTISAGSCYNNIKDPGERGVDCGGPCSACITLEFTADINDASIRGYASDYSTARSTSSSRSYNYEGGIYTPLTVGQYFMSSSYSIQRVFYKFDTSLIPDNAIISQVKFKTKISDSSFTNDFDIQIVKYNWEAQESFYPTTKIQEAYIGCLNALADDNILTSTLGISTGVEYTSGNLDITRVNKIGNTYYCLRSSRDNGNTAPTGGEYVSLARPTLEVTYTTP